MIEEKRREEKRKEKKRKEKIATQLTSILRRLGPDDLRIESESVHACEMTKNRDDENENAKTKTKGDFRDVVHAMCEGLDTSELDQYVAMIFDRMNAQGDRELSLMVDSSPAKKAQMLSMTLKRIVFFTALNADAWMRDWVCDPRAANRSRPPLDARLRAPFFAGLRMLWEKNTCFRMDDVQFLGAVRNVYGTIVAEMRGEEGKLTTTLPFLG